MWISVTGRCHDLTGTHVKRTQMFRLIERLGQRAQSKVTSGTELLIVSRARYGDPSSTKQRQAEQLGIPTITDYEFFRRFVRDNEPLDAHAFPRAGVTRQPSAREAGRMFDDLQREADQQEADMVRQSMAQAETVLGNELTRERHPGQVFTVNGEQVTEDAYNRRRRTTQEALADPRREEVMADVREQMKSIPAQMKSIPAHKPYKRERKIRLRNHRKADYT